MPCARCHHGLQACHLTMLRTSNGFHDLCKGIKVIIKGSKSSLSHQGPLIQQMWVQRLLHHDRGFLGFYNYLNHTRRPPRVKISSVGMLGLLLGYHDIIIAWMTIEWVINASPTHLGLSHRPSRLQDHIQGLQHHQHGLQHFQQGGGIKILSCA